MTWAEGLFSGYSGMFSWGLMAALGAIVLALPSALISRFTPRFDLLGWAASVILAIVVGLILFGGQLQPSLAAADYLRFMNIFAPVMLVLVVPQLAAYPLTRSRPLFRPLVAAGIAILGAAVWIAGGVMSGVTPD